ncbi:MAG: HD domain-containing protein [Thermodesulfovibrionales bacterium]
MRDTELSALKQWFSRYVRAFYSDVVEDQRNIVLKEAHTARVCENMRTVAAEEGFRGGELLLAETVALLHDVGRFPQYARFKTFRDSRSVNHAELGTEIIEREGILSTLLPEQREIVLASVRFHNAFGLPALKSPDAMTFLKLIRDADKLDIWRVFIEYYGAPAGERASAVALDVPDTPEFSREILACLREGRVAPLAKVSTLTDYKLLQLSWMHEIHFDATCRLIIERDFIGRLVRFIPEDPALSRAVDSVSTAIRRRITGGVP